MQTVLIKDLSKFVGTTVLIKGWIYNFRSSGKIYFLQVRDGSGEVQVVADEAGVGDEVFAGLERLTIESSASVTGEVKAEPRSPGGFEIRVQALEIMHQSEPYPIAKKAHGVEFLLDHRHLWLRSARQRAIMRIRDEISWALRSFFRNEGFVLIDTPILTPTACEGTTTLFATDYFGEPAYLSQSGQLYLEAACAALGRVYDFGPTFRAEKSKTRRHLMEFWMLDAEVAFAGHAENMRFQEQLVTAVVQAVLTNCQAELAALERDTKLLEAVKPPFPVITYDHAVTRLQQAGSDIKTGDDLGGDDETTLAQQFDRPVFIEKYPASLKAFYMQPDPSRPDRVLCDDLLAPEGYGEIVGGSERIDDAALLEQRLRQHKLPAKEFSWYVDLRRYGSFPHAGFGLGLERTVAWLCGLDHVRETIAFPRLLNRLRP